MKKMSWLIFCIISICCGKEKPDTPVEPPNPTSDKPLLGALRSDQELLKLVPIVQQSDTTLIGNYLSRIMGTRHEIVGMPTPRKQNLNDCVAWAIGYGVVGYYYGAIETSPGAERVFSPAYIYNQLNGKKNDGINCMEALQLVEDKGCCKWSFMPSDFNFTKEVTPAAKENAKDYYFSEFRRFPTIDLPLVKKFISKNYPIVFSADIYSGFLNDDRESYREASEGRRIFMKSTGKLEGGHTMVICGYDDEVSAFKVLNSWGKDKGNDGFYWIDYEYFKDIVGKFVLGLYPEIYLAIPRRVITNEVSEISAVSAQSGGHILTDAGNAITERGVCYGLSPQPLVSGTKTSSGTGIGKFLVEVKNLLPDTNYYMRAYTIEGTKVFYGNEVKFRTLKKEAPGIDKLTCSIVSGNNQLGSRNNRLPSPLVVKITDTDHNTVEGIDVSFEPKAGIVNRLKVKTDNKGLASVEWTLPATGEEFQLEVFYGEGNNRRPGATFNAFVSDDIPKQIYASHSYQFRNHKIGWLYFSAGKSDGTAAAGATIKLQVNPAKISLDNSEIITDAEGMAYVKGSITNAAFDTAQIHASLVYKDSVLSTATAIITQMPNVANRQYSMSSHTGGNPLYMNYDSLPGVAINFTEILQASLSFKSIVPEPVISFLEGILTNGYIPVEYKAKARNYYRSLVNGKVIDSIYEVSVEFPYYPVRFTSISDMSGTHKLNNTLYSYSEKVYYDDFYFNDGMKWTFPQGYTTASIAFDFGFKPILPASGYMYISPDMTTLYLFYGNSRFLKKEPYRYMATFK